jgi:hypothetical protein
MNSEWWNIVQWVTLIFVIIMAFVAIAKLTRRTTTSTQSSKDYNNDTAYNTHNTSIFHKVRRYATIWHQILHQRCNRKESQDNNCNANDITPVSHNVDTTLEKGQCQSQKSRTL